MRHRVGHVGRHAVGVKTNPAGDRPTPLFLCLAIGIHEMSRNTDDGGTGRHTLQHHRVRPDPCAVTDRYRSQHLRAGTDHDPVAQCRMALALLPARATQRDAVIERAVIADDGGFSDHHAHAVIDEEAVPDLRPGVNLDTGPPARKRRDHSSRPAQTLVPQPVREPVHQHGMHTRIGRHDLPERLRGRIPLEDDTEFVSKTL